MILLKSCPNATRFPISRSCDTAQYKTACQLNLLSFRSRIGALLVQETYFEATELKVLVSNLLTPLKDTKADPNVVEALLTLLHEIVEGSYSNL